MEENGADIIDIGGESTRPGSAEVTAEEEMKRVLPVIEGLQGKLSIPISIDSYKAVTAEKALEAGAHIINDVWGFQRDKEMADVAAKFQCPSIVMHNKVEAVYNDLMSELMAFYGRVSTWVLAPDYRKARSLWIPVSALALAKLWNTILH